MSKTTELHNMRLHEELLPSVDRTLTIMRVPDGWIYTFYDVRTTGEPGCPSHDYVGHSVFVPWSDEFA